MIQLECITKSKSFACAPKPCAPRPYHAIVEMQMPHISFLRLHGIRNPDHNVSHGEIEMLLPNDNDLLVRSEMNPGRVVSHGEVKMQTPNDSHLLVHSVMNHGMVGWNENVHLPILKLSNPR